jgi:hypothetical protein
MSGIINRPGSESGIIGTTELDYEEGTWTPVIADAGSGGNVAVPDSGGAVGNYTKIGNTVTVNALYQMASEGLTDGNTLYIRGFPYSTSSLANCNYIGAVFFYRIDTLVNTTLVMGVSDPNAYCQEKYTASDWNATNISCGDIRYASTCNMRLNITYQTDS